jgi:hypothetical protein
MKVRVPTPITDPAGPLDDVARYARLIRSMCSDMLAMVRDELSVMVGDGAGGRGGVPQKLKLGSLESCCLHNDDQKE